MTKYKETQILINNSKFKNLGYSEFIPKSPQIGLLMLMVSAGT